MAQDLSAFLNGEPKVKGLPTEYGGTGDSLTVTTGSLFVGRVTDSMAVLAIGAEGDVLTVSGGTAVWAPAAASGAPTTATYLTLSLDGTLSAERVLTAGTAISFSDTGANGTLTINNTGVTSLSATASQTTVSGATGAVTIGTVQDIATTSSPTFTGLTVSGLTASRLVQTNGSSALASVANLTSWIAGTANQITVTDDLDGTVTLSLPQNIHTAATPIFASLTLSGLTQGSVIFAGSGGLLSQDNTNFFWDDTNDALVIGQNSASIVVNSASLISKLTVDMSGDFIGSLVHQHTNTAAFASNMILAKSRGTHGAPTIVATGDTIGILGAYGYSGNSSVGYLKSAQIRFDVATGTPSTTSMPGLISFYTTPDASVTPARAMLIDSNKNITMDAYGAGFAKFSSAGLLSSNTITSADITDFIDQVKFVTRDEITQRLFQLKRKPIYSSDVLDFTDAVKFVTNDLFKQLGHGIIPVRRGGTNITQYATGDIIYASNPYTLSRLAVGTDTHVLTLSGGLPTWAAPTGGGSMAIGGTVTSGTTGSILYVAAGPVLAQDNANFFYDSASTRLRVPEIAGGTAASGNLILYSTTNATKGDIKLEGLVDIYSTLTASTNLDIVHMMPTLTQSAGTINYFRISPTATISGAGVITRVFTCDGTWTQSGSSIFNIYNMFYSAATLTTSDTNVPPAPLTFYNQTSYNIKHGVGTTSVVVKGYTDQGSIVASAAAATSVVIAGYTSFDTIPQLSATHASASMTITNRIGYNVGDITSTATGSITVTNNIGINVVNLTQGTSGSRTYNNAYGIYSVMSTGTNKYFINSDADAPSLHQGHFRIGKASTTASELQFANATNSNITAFKAGVASAAVTYTLPTADGTSGQVLKTNGSGVLSWTTAAGSSPLTTKGDIFTFSTVDARLAVGTNGQNLEADSSQTTGLKWTKPYGFNVFGSTLTVGGTSTVTLDISAQNTCEMVMPFAGEIYAISIGTSADRTAGTLTGQYLKNGAADATNTVIINATNVRRFYRLFTTPVTFAAGDYISLQTVTASFTPTSNDALVTLFCRRT